MKRNEAVTPRKGMAMGDAAPSMPADNFGVGSMSGGHIAGEKANGKMLANHERTKPVKHSSEKLASQANPDHGPHHIPAGWKGK